MCGPGGVPQLVADRDAEPTVVRSKQKYINNKIKLQKLKILDPSLLFIEHQPLQCVLGGAGIGPLVVEPLMKTLIFVVPLFIFVSLFKIAKNTNLDI